MDDIDRILSLAGLNRLVESPTQKMVNGRKVYSTPSRRTMIQSVQKWINGPKYDANNKHHKMLTDLISDRQMILLDDGTIAVTERGLAMGAEEKMDKLSQNAPTKPAATPVDLVTRENPDVEFRPMLRFSVRIADGRAYEPYDADQIMEPTSTLKVYIQYPLSGFKIQRKRHTFNHSNGKGWTQHEFVKVVCAEYAKLTSRYYLEDYVLEAATPTADGSWELSIGS